MLKRWGGFLTSVMQRFSWDQVHFVRSLVPEINLNKKFEILFSLSTFFGTCTLCHTKRVHISAHYAYSDKRPSFI